MRIALTISTYAQTMATAKKNLLKQLKAATSECRNIPKPKERALQDERVTKGHYATTTCTHFKLDD